MNIDFTYEIEREVNNLLENALQYGEGGDYKVAIREAKDLEALKTILSSMVEELLHTGRY
tara:strand:+ start:424 stop:603 length:180 start_codon:yes stop_codon:yes gene_type:complete